MKKSLAALFALLLVVPCLLMNARAETQTDWNNTDWKTFRWGSMSEEEFRSLVDWLENEADLEAVFRVVFEGQPDGAYTEMVEDRLNELFMEDPSAFICALATKDAQVQTVITDAVAFYSYYDGNESIPATVNSLQMSDFEKESEQQVLALLKSGIAQRWGNPKTADPVGVFAALLALSAPGAGVLLTRKKEF